LKKGRGIYTPPGIIAIAVLQGPDIPVQVWTGYSAPLKKLLRTSRVSFRFGAGYFGRIFPKLGRIFRPPLKTAKDQKKVRRASLRFEAGYFDRIFPKPGRIFCPRKASNTKTAITFASGLRFR
jgi:hypothetical protein